MIYAVLVSIAIIVLGICWFLYLRNIELFLCLLIAINFELFYLVPKIKGPDDYKLLLLPIIIILIFESFIKGKLAFGRYGWWIVSFLGISIFGVIVAYYSGQSILLGIKAAKFIPLVFVYFLLAGRHTNGERFIKYFIIMSLAVASIATVQFFLHGGINIFPGMPEEMEIARRVNPRLTIGQFVISTASITAFACYLHNSRLLFLFAAAALFLEVLFIQQTRGFIAAIILSTFVVYILSNKLTLLRIAIYLVIAGIGLASWTIISSKVSNYELVVKTKSDIRERKGSYQGRINSYMYYFDEIQKRPITGHGILNFNWEGNREKILQQNAIHLSDIGITHFILQSGLIGFVWLLYGLFCLWFDIFRFGKKLIITSYFIIATFTLPTLDMLLRFDTLFLFSVFLGLSSNMIETFKSDPIVVGG